MIRGEIGEMRNLGVGLWSKLAVFESAKAECEVERLAPGGVSVTRRAPNVLS